MMGNRLPDWPEHNGIQAILAADFGHFVRVCVERRATTDRPLAMGRRCFCCPRTSSRER